MQININKHFVKPILYLSHFISSNVILVVCKGYGDDYKYYTELYWNEDKEISFSKDSQYYDYQIWLF